MHKAIFTYLISVDGSKRKIRTPCIPDFVYKLVTAHGNRIIGVVPPGRRLILEGIEPMSIGDYASLPYLEDTLEMLVEGMEEIKEVRELTRPELCAIAVVYKVASAQTGEAKRSDKIMTRLRDLLPQPAPRKRLRYHHFRSPGRSGEAPRLRATLAVEMSTNGEPVRWGVAFVDPRDNPSYRVGREMATARLRLGIEKPLPAETLKTAIMKLRRIERVSYSTALGQGYAAVMTIRDILKGGGCPHYTP